MSQSSVSGKVFGVVVRGQSYLNILYLLLAFPLGLTYFIFLVTGLAVGFGLFITLVGIPILLLVLGGSWVLCSIERWLARTLLNESISPAPSRARATQTSVSDSMCTNIHISLKATI